MYTHTCMHAYMHTYMALYSVLYSVDSSFFHIACLRVVHSLFKYCLVGRLYACSLFVRYVCRLSHGMLCYATLAHAMLCCVRYVCKLAHTQVRYVCYVLYACNLCSRCNVRKICYA